MTQHDLGCYCAAVMTREYSPTASVGVSTVQLAVERLGWIFRRQLDNDYGIDAHIEIVSDGKPTGRLIGLQIKTGKSYLDEIVAAGYVYRGTREHLEYWLGSSLPVVLILVDDVSGKAYWEHLTTETVEFTDKAWKVTVPFTQQVDGSSIQSFLDLTEAPEPVRRLNELILAEPWIAHLSSGGRIVIEAGDWINKTSGRAELKVLIIESDESERVALEWPLMLLTSTPFDTALREFFPWAELRVDEEFYAEIEEQNWIEGHGIWDSEDDEYFYDHDELAEYLTSRDPYDIRPYEYSAGEVAAYRVELELNELGESFLIVSRYLHDEQVGIRPAVPGGIPKRVKRRKK